MRKTVLLLASMALAVLLACGVALAAAGDTTRVSVSSSGNDANGTSDWASISTDGRFVAFSSNATNLVPGDTSSDSYDIFVRDRQMGTTELVSVDSFGNPPEFGMSIDPSLSADGRFVAFSSNTNLIPGDTNGGTDDIFVRDRQTGTTELVSVDSSGNQADSYSYLPSLSADGRFVAFSSTATNLVPGDTNGKGDIFVHDRQTNTTERVNVDSSGNQANKVGTSGSGGSWRPSISADGRFVAFYTHATNLVPDDANGDFDVFVHDRQTGTTQRVSVDSSGNQGNYDSYGTSISPDGRFVAFTSRATNLVPGDTNGGEGVFSGLDVFVHDRQTGTTQRVSVSSSGNQADNGSLQAGTTSYGPPISADGRFVAFTSRATNLVPGDTNGDFDVFVHEFEVDTKAPRIVSVGPDRGATDVSRGVNVKATFAERVYEVKSNFTLYRKGSSTPVGAVVSSVEGTNNTKWVLDPDSSLRAGTTYIAKVKTGVVDKVGHHLDQNLSQRGNQPMQWIFKTRN